MSAKGFECCSGGKDVCEMEGAPDNWGIDPLLWEKIYAPEI